MTSFLLPKWVIRDIDKLCRNFLWRCATSASKGVSLINWSLVCTPKKFGGLGLLNIALHNKCLLLRWWWRLFVPQCSLWKDIASMLLTKSTGNAGPLLWKKSGSFMWKQLYELRYLFQFATRWTIGNGANVSFWFDNWGGAPLRFMLNKEAFQVPHRFSSVRKMVNENFIAQNLPRTFHDDRLVSTLLAQGLTSQADKIYWRWASDGDYSSAGLYQLLVSSGKVASRYREVWSLCITPTLQFFLFLLLNKKLLTQDVLQRRGLFLQPFCHFCSLHVLETHQHLFSDCTVIANFLHQLTILIGQPVTSTTQRCGFWFDYCCKELGQKKTCFPSSVLFIALHRIWKERNSRVFNSRVRSLNSMSQEIIQEARWMFKHC